MFRRLSLMRSIGHARPLTSAVVALALGCGAPDARPEATTTMEGDSAAARVTGIGGIFFESADPARTMAWYREHLGIATATWGGHAFQWTERGRPDETGYTIWNAFPDTTGYFAPSDQPFMINFRVTNLDGLVAALRDAGVEVVGGVEQHPNGKFAWILDPEGRKVELWEPVPSAVDPYLR